MPRAEAAEARWRRAGRDDRGRGRAAVGHHPHRRADGLRQLPAAARSAPPSAPPIPISTSRSSRCPRVVNLSRREADLAITVSQPATQRLRAEKLSDYHLSLAASRAWLATHGAPDKPEALKGARMIGYIPDMIFDAELDYLAQLGVTRVPLASNAVSVQLNLCARGARGWPSCMISPCPPPRNWSACCPCAVRLTRSFWLVTHAGPRDARLERVSTLLRDGMRAEIARLEASVVA